MNRLITLSLLGSLSLVSGVNAAITNVTGATTWLLTPPTSAMPGALPNPVAHAWNEQQNVSVAGLPVNIAASTGAYTGTTPYAGIVSGTYDSHFIHFDLASGIASVSGGVSFSSQIVAVIYEDALLDISDPIFGAGGTTYPTFFPFRSHGSTLNNSVVKLFGTSMTFDLFGDVQTRMIELRVLTQAVPAPGSLAMVGLGGLVAMRRRR